MNQGRKILIGVLSPVLVLITLAIAQVPPQPPPPPLPALKISLLSTNQVLLQITNGLSTELYEVYRRLDLVDPAYEWVFQTNGVAGQTNFTATFDEFVAGFFKATLPDWDADGVPNWQDGDPEDPNVLTLSITIDSPATGTIFN